MPLQKGPSLELLFAYHDNNRVEKISSTYSICDLAQLTAKPFAVLACQMSTCASTVSA